MLRPVILVQSTDSKIVHLPSAAKTILGPVTQYVETVCPAHTHSILPPNSLSELPMGCG